MEIKKGAVLVGRVFSFRLFYSVFFFLVPCIPWLSLETNHGIHGKHGTRRKKKRNKKKEEKEERRKGRKNWRFGNSRHSFIISLHAFKV